MGWLIGIIGSSTGLLLLIYLFYRSLKNNEAIIAEKAALLEALETTNKQLTNAIAEKEKEINALNRQIVVLKNNIEEMHEAIKGMSPTAAANYINRRLQALRDL